MLYRFAQKKMPKCISAKIVADSINEQGDRITTFTVILPRFLLSEFNTHRMFSRNSASSRARPFQVMLKEVLEDPFIPIKWLSHHKGMQGTNEVDNPELSKKAWLQARDNAIKSALELDKTDVTKQLVNRLIEPFMFHEIIVTSTTYENFFALRAHADAEIHIAYLAQLMLDEYNASTPQLLKQGEWHLPFGDQMDDERIMKLVSDLKTVDMLKREIASARCARISYKTFGSEDSYNYEADCKLFNSLVSSNHMSPTEHSARAMTQEEYNINNAQSGNFKGFIQFRKLFASENQCDSRVMNKRRRKD